MCSFWVENRKGLFTVNGLFLSRACCPFPWTRYRSRQTELARHAKRKRSLFGMSLAKEKTELYPCHDGFGGANSGDSDQFLAYHETHRQRGMASWLSEPGGMECSS